MDTATSPYLLIFRDSSLENYEAMSAEDRQQFVTRWNAWFDGLAAQGKLQDGRPLEPEGRTVSGPRGERIVDGPFAESKEAVGGFFLLSVKDIDEATTIARQCPGLAYGMQVEVRPVADCCHVAKAQKHDQAARDAVTA